MGIGVKKVGHVVLKVRDLERAVAFYRDIIGLKEVARGHADPAIWRGDPPSVAHAQPLSL